MPPGTRVIRDGEVIATLEHAGERVPVARGGDGGIGNRAFRSSTHRAPRETVPGGPGEEAWLTLELRLPVDVALVGLPNSGKSALLRALTGAAATVAALPAHDHRAGARAAGGRGGAPATWSPTCPGSPPTARRGAAPTWSSSSARAWSLHCVDAARGRAGRRPPGPGPRRAGARSCPPGARELVVATRIDLARPPPGVTSPCPPRAARASTSSAAGCSSWSAADGDHGGQDRHLRPWWTPTGRLRDDVIEARVRELVRVRHRGHRPVLVSAEPWPAGSGCWASRAPDRPARPSGGVGGGPGGADRALPRRRSTSTAWSPAQVLLTPPTSSAEPRTSTPATRCATARTGRGPVVNENDTTATDEHHVRRQRRSGGAGGDLLRALVAGAAHRSGRPLRAWAGGAGACRRRPGRGRPRELVLADMRGVGIGRGGVASKIASARAWPRRPGSPASSPRAPRTGSSPAVATGSHVGTRFRPTARRRVGLQALAALREADDGPGAGRRRCRAGAVARGNLASAGGRRRVRGRFAAGDAVEVISADGAGWWARASPPSRPTSCARWRGSSPPRCAAVLPDAAEEVVHRDQFVLL